jgi:uncharacterized protein with PIN domain
MIILYITMKTTKTGTPTIDELETCPNCGVILIPVMENVGFEENPHYETTGLRCPECGGIYD